MMSAAFLMASSATGEEASATSVTPGISLISFQNPSWRALLSGGSWAVTDERDAVRGADFIYTDVWYGLYENEMPKEERVRVFADYQVNRELMQLGALGCKFLHCLPATRGEDVTDEVADSAASLCWEQAGNRLTAMRGLLVYFTRCRRVPSELELAAAQEELDTFLDARLGGC